MLLIFLQTANKSVIVKTALEKKNMRSIIECALVVQILKGYLNKKTVLADDINQTKGHLSEF